MLNLQRWLVSSRLKKRKCTSRLCEGSFALSVFGFDLAGQWGGGDTGDLEASGLQAFRLTFDHRVVSLEALRAQLQKKEAEAFSKGATEAHLCSRCW